MISLRNHIDGYMDPVGEAALQAYRSALVTIGECGEWAVPELGDELSRTLAAISEALNKPATPEDLNDANARLKTELSNSAGRRINAIGGTSGRSGKLFLWWRTLPRRCRNAARAMRERLDR